MDYPNQLGQILCILPEFLSFRERSQIEEVVHFCSYVVISIQSAI